MAHETLPLVSSSAVDRLTGLFTGMLDGLQLEFVSGTVVTVKTGRARSSDDATTMFLAADTTIDLDTTGAGGLDTGTKTDNVFYHTYLMGDTSGQNPTTVVASLDNSTPTLLAGYNVFRRIGAFRNNVTIFIFVQRGSGRTKRHGFNITATVKNGSQNTSFLSLNMLNGAPDTAALMQLEFTFTPNASGDSFFLRWPDVAPISASIWTHRVAGTVESTHVVDFAPLPPTHRMEVAVSDALSVLNTRCRAFTEYL